MVTMPGAGQSRLLMLVYVAFLARGLFYCVQMPLWEGFDEWAHFAYVQHVAEHGRWPDRGAPVSDEIRSSLTLVPLSASAVESAPERITHDAFWLLPAEERSRREQALLNLHRTSMHIPTDAHPARQYEGQQPPLYFAILALPYSLVDSWSLPARALLLRIGSLLIASLLIPVTWKLAAITLPPGIPRILPPLLVACMPGLFISFCRISNETLSVTVMSCLALVSVQVASKREATRTWVLLGVVYGVALLTKAYAVALLPLLPLLAVVRVLRFGSRPRHEARHLVTAVAIALAISGWWYWITWKTTGSISGEMLDHAAATMSYGRKFEAFLSMSWLRTLDSAAFTHLWVGGWSFLVVRSWMYRVFECLVLLAVAGLVVLYIRLALRAWRRKALRPLSARLLILTLIPLALTAAVAYHALLMFLVKDTTAAIGWYLHSVSACEVVLCAWGFAALAGTRWARRLLSFSAALFAALDVYTVHFLLIPYYTGFIRHSKAGSLQSFRISAISDWSSAGEVLQRLAVNEPAFIGPAFVAAAWAGYALATALLLSLALRSLRGLTPS